MQPRPRLLFTLLIISFVAIISLGCKGATDTEHVANAEKYLDTNELGPALIELKNALIKNPNNIKARWMLGKVQIEVGDYPSAEKELSKALSLGISAESVQPLITYTLLMQGKYKDVLEIKPSLGWSSSARTEITALQGTALLELNKLAEADEAFNTALKNDPDSTWALLGKARLAFINNDATEARSWLDKTFKVDPGFVPAWDFLGDMEQLDKRLEAAETAYTKAIEHQTYNQQFRLKRAIVRIQQEKYKEAQDDVDILKKRSPKDPLVAYAQGLLYFSQNNYESALESFQTVLARIKHTPTLYYMGVTNYILKNLESAESYLSQFLVQEPNNLAAIKLLALIELQSGNFIKTEKLLRPVVEGNDNDILILNLLATSLLEQGKTMEGAQLLKKAIKIEPTSADTQMKLGIALLLQGNKETGRNNILKAIEIDPNLSKADGILVSSYLRDKTYDKALETAEESLRKHPDSAQSHTLLGLVHLAIGNKETAETYFEKANTLKPGDPTANQKLAALALMQSMPDKARMYYHRILEQNPNHLPTLLSLAKLEASQGNNEEMLKLLEQADATHPNEFLPKVFLARYFLKEGNAEHALDILSKINPEYKGNPIYLGTLGLTQLAVNDNNGATYTFENLVKINPESAEAHFLLANAYAASMRPEEVRNSLNKALELNPKHLPSRLMMARLDNLSNKPDDALNNLEIIKKELKSDSSVLLMEESKSEQQLGDNEQALNALEKAFEIDPSTKTLLALTRYKWATGDTLNAVVILEQWLKTHPNDITIRNTLADAYSALGRKSDAVAQYKKVLEITDSNVDALNNLAWELRTSDSHQALTYAEKAAEIAPQSPQILDTLAVILLDQDKLDRAQRIIERALAAAPSDPGIRYHDAMILSAQGKTAEAKIILEQLLEEGVTFSELEDAKMMLDRLSRL